MTAARLVRRPISADALLEAVASPAHGAVTLFLGTVREQNGGRPVSGIDYSAYDAMAERELARIVDAARAGHPGVLLAVEHRLGTLAVGETSVGIAAAHAHRAPALDALRFVIEAIKVSVPIWKREHYADGTRAWVAAGPVAP
ncbi:MAG: molybdenum cofactor biosynthesis protein MoaE [Gemmatimonadaceae bacterium]